MSPRNRLLGIVGIVLSGIGTVICAAAMVAIWIVSVRIGRLSETLFSKMDQSLIAVRQRVDRTQDRVAAATTSSKDIEETLRDWGRREAGQQLATRLDAAERTERLASALRQADSWLEVAQSSIEQIQDLLSVNAATTASSETTIVGKLTADITAVRAQLGDVIGLVGSLRDRIADATDEKSAKERIEQAIQLTLRVPEILGSINSSLDTFLDRLSATQSQLQDLETRTRRWILAIAIGVTLLTLLMAAGQVALCWLSWRRLQLVASAQNANPA
jgi:chromosome segregation ATPase